MRVRVIVSGLVHGVGYREGCRRQAAAQEVAGWVRNLPDGTVEAVFEGPPERVARLLRWARQGPNRAMVRDVAVFDEPPEALDGFTVRPTPLA